MRRSFQSLIEYVLYALTSPYTLIPFDSVKLRVLSGREIVWESSVKECWCRLVAPKAATGGFGM